MNCLLEKSSDGSKWQCQRESCDYEMPFRPHHKAAPKRNGCGEKRDTPKAADLTQRCQHLGPPTGFVECETCQGNVRLKVFACEIHQAATMAKPMNGLACCATCKEYLPVRDHADEDGSRAG